MWCDKMTEKEITSILKEALDPLSFVYAFWFEGSFATGHADEYSDIDYWVDVDDDKVFEMLDIVEAALKKIGEIDARDENNNGHPKLGQVVYHIKGTNPFLVLDFNWQLHSRNRDEYSYYNNDIVEGVKVIFDKDNVVKIEEMDPQVFTNNRLSCITECDYKFSQLFRVRKYIFRETFAECYAYYNNYVIVPLVTMLRLKYTPMYPHHYLLHISNHIPSSDLNRLEKLLQTSNLKDIEEAINDAEKWYNQLRNEILLLEKAD